MSRQHLSRCLSLSAAAIGAVALVGWIFGIPMLTRLHVSWVAMKANTAICFIIAGTAAALIADPRCSKRNLRLAQIFAALVFTTATLTLLEYVGQWDFGIDEALFKESAESAGRSFPGRMGPISALIFMCFGVSIVWLDFRTRAGSWPAQTFIILAGFLTILIFLGYFYHVELPVFLGKYSYIALPTVVAFMLLGAGLLFARPERGMMVVFLADGVGGVTARRLLPAAILIPSLAGWLFAMGRENGYYGRGVAVALLAATITIVFTWLIWWTSKVIGRTAEALRRSIDEATVMRQKAEMASRAKDDFLAALSHELRTPLTPVLLTATDLAGDPSLPSELREDMDMICRNVSLEARLIDDLLDLTRITKGKLALELSCIGVHEVLKHALEIVRADIAGRQLEFRLSLEARHDFVLADSTRMQQVFWNILKNAVKFTPDGGAIEIRSSNPTPNRFSVSVTDTGRGIAKELLDRIFHPFDQGGLNGRHHFGGLGLGLAISKSLIDLHDGRLTASSEGAGRGATFTVELPTLEGGAQRAPEKPRG
jgi:signal transduction histidine kinase